MGVPDELEAMKTNPKFIFFTDFDGTITLSDSNDYLTDNIGYGATRRKAENADTLAGRNTFRASFEGMMQSITAPFPQCIDLLVQNIQLDPYFKDFFDWSLQHNIPVVVLSSGMVPIIRALLDHLVGPSSAHIQIIANDVRAKPGMRIDQEDGWEVAFHDESDYGHDKSLAIRPYRNLPAAQRPTMFYAGDGVSDLSAARETDLLFAKEGKDLVTYCAKEGVPFTTFRDWESIMETVQRIVEGKISAEDAAREGWNAYKKETGAMNGSANGSANGHAK